MEEEIIIWNDITQELLVEYVKCYPSLWDRRHVDYSRKDKNWRRWGKIGHFLDCSGEEAQHQFHLLKKRFLKYVEKLKTNNYKKFKPFFLAEKMGYLLCSETLETFTLPTKSKITKKDSFVSFNLEAIFAYSEGTNTQEDDSITEITPATGGPAVVSTNALKVSTGGKKVSTGGKKVSIDGKKVSNEVLKVSEPTWTGCDIPCELPRSNTEEAISVYAEVLGGPYDDDPCSSSDSTQKFRSKRSRQNYNFCTRNKFNKKKKVSVV